MQLSLQSTAHRFIFCITFPKEAVPLKKYLFTHGFPRYVQYKKTQTNIVLYAAKGEICNEFT